jgi:hypothetical protein
MRSAIMLAVAAGFTSAAHADFTEGFENFTGAGWTFSNQSNPLGPDNWSTTFAFAHTGAQSLLADYLAGSGISTLSVWAELPVQTLHNGDTFSFWTAGPFNNVLPDRLQVRLSTNGASSNTGTTEFDVGDFTTLLLDINPTYDLGVYPTNWTQFTIVISGLPAPTSGRLAFRYFVENGGPDGPNSDEIFIDDLAYTSAACYANCDGSTTAPILNVNDFICFQGRFASGDSYANCDGSTTAPILTVNDFICFQSAFAAGCP